MGKKPLYLVALSLLAAACTAGEDATTLRTDSVKPAVEVAIRPVSLTELMGVPPIAVEPAPPPPAEEQPLPAPDPAPDPEPPILCPTGQYPYEPCLSDVPQPHRHSAEPSSTHRHGSSSASQGSGGGSSGGGSASGCSASGPPPPDYIVQRESGGNYTAVNPSSGASGAYQFLDSTWQSVGGSGSASNASPAEQDCRAAALWANGAGSSHWQATR